MRRPLRVLGLLMVTSGVALLAWVLLVWQWQDPFTAAYTRWQQHQLASLYDERLGDFRSKPPRARVSLAAARREVARDAAAYRRTLGRAEPIGRLRVPRLGLDAIVVEGTDQATLKRGPGRYAGTFLPGQGKLIYVAGHRTTYGAPFARIDRLRPGDLATFDLPYGTFVYRVRGHRIVAATEISVLRSRNREELALQACHPRFFASHRYIVYADLVRVEPRGGPAYAPRVRLAAAG